MITEQEVYAAFCQVFPQQAEKSCTAVHKRNIADRLNKLGADAGDLVQALLSYQSTEKGRYCPTWKELWPFVPVKRSDGGQRVWNVIRVMITRDGWERAIQEIFSDASGTGTGFEDTQEARRLLIAAGINSNTPAWGPDGVFPESDYLGWFEMHANHDVARGLELLGHSKESSACKGRKPEDVLTYFPFSRPERFEDVKLPTDVRAAIDRYMASMKQRTEQVKG